MREQNVLGREKDRIRIEREPGKVQWTDGRNYFGIQVVRGKEPEDNYLEIFGWREQGFKTDNMTHSTLALNQIHQTQGYPEFIDFQEQRE